MNRTDYLLTLLLLLLFTSCASHIPKFKGTAYLKNQGRTPKPVFNKQALKPLKLQWKACYQFLKKGHVQQFTQKNGFSYIYSHQFYRFLQSNLFRIYETPFLQYYDHFVLTFGEPEDDFSDAERIRIVYWPQVVDDPCTTCPHDGFGFSFDANTKELLRE